MLVWAFLISDIKLKLISYPRFVVFDVARQNKNKMRLDGFDGK